MTFYELNDAQKLQLKQWVVETRNEERGEGTSYEELSMADDLVDDEVLEDWYGDTDFTAEDFTEEV